MQKCILTSTGYTVLVLWFSGIFTIAGAAVRNWPIGSIELQPDLRVETADIPATAYVGQAFPVSVTIMNGGDDWANTSSLEYVLSADVSWSSDDIPLGADIIGILPPEGRESKTRTLISPDWVPAGMQYLLLRCDAGDVVEESDEQNIFSYPIDLQAKHFAQADFIVYNLVVPAGVRLGDPFAIQAEVRNNGDLPAPFCNWSIRISTDAALSADDPVAGVYFAPPLAPGQSAPLQATVQLGMDYPTSGGHHLFIVIDSGEKVPESNENNNTTKSAFELRGFPPPADCKRDLGAGSLLCAQANPGGGFTLHKKVQGNLETVVLDANGNLIGTPQTTPLTEDSVLVRSRKIVQKLANGTVVFQKDIPAAITTVYPRLEAATRLKDGSFVLAGFQQYPDPQGNTALNRDSLVVIRTDADLNLRNAIVVTGNSGATDRDRVHTLYATADGGFTLVYTLFATRLIPTPFLTIVKYDALFRVKNTTILDGRTLQSLTHTPCGNWLLTAAYQTASAKGYDAGNQLSWIDPETGSLQRRMVAGLGSLAQFGAFRDYFLETLNPDSLFTGFSALREGAPFDSVNLVFKRPGSGSALVRQRLPFMAFQQIVIASDDRHLLVGAENGKLWAYTNACKNSTGAKPDLELGLQTDTPLPKRWQYVTLTLTVKNTGAAEARDIRIDFMNQSDAAVWSRLAYVSANVPPGSTYNNWYGYWTIPSLLPGESKVLTYRLFTKVAETILVFAQVAQASTPDADSTPGNNSSQNQAREDDEALLILPVLPADHQQRIHGSAMDLPEDGFAMSAQPNPAQSSVLLYLRAAAETPVRIYLRDALGRIVREHTLSVAETAVEEWQVSDLPNGTYLLQAAGISGNILAKSLLIVNH